MFVATGPFRSNYGPALVVDVTTSKGILGSQQLAVLETFSDKRTISSIRSVVTSSGNPWPDDAAVNDELRHSRK